MLGQIGLSVDKCRYYMFFYYINICDRSSTWSNIQYFSLQFWQLCLVIQKLAECLTEASIKIIVLTC